MNRYTVRDDSRYAAPDGGRMAAWSVVDRVTRRAVGLLGAFETRREARENAARMSADYETQRLLHFRGGDSTLANYLANAGAS